MRKLDCIKGCGDNRTILDGEIKRRNKWLNSSNKKHFKHINLGNRIV